MIKAVLHMMLFFCLTGSASLALADYYKYTDASGGVHITNKLEGVPSKYRSHMKVITDDALVKRDPGAGKQQQPAPAQEESSSSKAEEPAPVSAAAPQGTFAELSARYVWFKPLVYLAGFLVGLLAVIKLASVVPSGQLSKLIYLSFFMAVMVFLYKAYVEHVVTDSLAVKEKAVNMMKKSVVREVPLPGEAPPPETK
jgi:cation transport ATPase